MRERIEPVIPESREVNLQGYIQVINDFCADLASELDVPRDLLQRRELIEFYSVVIDAV